MPYNFFTSYLWDDFDYFMLPYVTKAEARALGALI